MSRSVVQLTIRMVTDDQVRQEAVWDQLVEWCDARTLFLGGSPDAAVIYGPLQPMTRRRRRQLVEWLTGCPDIQSSQLEFNPLRDLRSLRVKAACLEAFSQAQRYLAERMADCSDALAGLEPPTSRYWKTSFDERSNSLDLASRYLDIEISIFRRDRSPTSELQAFASRYLELKHLEPLEIDWVGLAWRRIASDGDQPIGQWLAESGPWRIHLYGNTALQLTHGEVMLRWMEAVCAG